MSVTPRRRAVHNVAYRYATQTIVAMLEGQGDGTALAGMAANFCAGLEIGAQLALVYPDLARAIVDDSDPDEIVAIAAAVETLRGAAE